MDAEGEDHSLTLWLRRHLMVPTLCLGPICNVCLCAACGFDRRPMYTAQVVLFNWQRLQASRSHVFFHQFVPPPPLLLSSPSSSFPSPLPGFFCFILFYFSPLLFSLSLSLSYNVYTLDSFGILPLLPFVFLLATRGRDARGPLELRTFTNCTSLATTSRSSSDNSKWRKWCLVAVQINSDFY